MSENKAEKLKVKVGDVSSCSVLEVPAVKAALVADLPKGATLSTVTRNSAATITVVKVT
jgi:hypothetical protein